MKSIDQVPEITSSSARIQSVTSFVHVERLLTHSGQTVSRMPSVKIISVVFDRWSNMVGSVYSEA